MEKEDESYILFMGTYPPRKCGIATFTRDLAKSTEKELAPLIKPKVIAINNDRISIYNYPKEVIYQINQNDIGDYIEVAKKINNNPLIRLISIQHEFGIFGGDYGSYLIAFLEILKKPVTITFHSIFPKPNPELRKLVQLLAEKSVCLVVMTQKGVGILREGYGIETDIKVIPHGIPPVQFTPNINEKKNLGYKDRILLSSFGMLNEGKGYEYVLEALPKIVEKFPSVLYLIIGETHPVVRKERGEKYRKLLERKVKELGLQSNVKFYDKYLTLEEILKYLQASDIYISSGLNKHQITSGTLVYAMGSGRAVISTPFLHAKDILNKDRGILLEKFRDSKGFANAILKLLSDKEYLKFCETNSYSYTRHMIWSNVALSYKEKFSKILNLPKTPKQFPKINLNHLINLTNKFGVIQFAEHTKPDIESGYSIDDNARALIAICMYNNLTQSKQRMSLIRTYLDYLKYVFEKDRFFNYSNKHKFVDKKDFSEDAHGRALWALGYLISRKYDSLELNQRAVEMFRNGLSISRNFKSPRAVAFTILGLYFYNKTYPEEENKLKIRKLADYLVSLYNITKKEEWKWFEEYLTYSNSKLPEALFYTFLVTKDSTYLDIAKNSLNFLISLTFENEMFSPIGQNGWHIRGKQRSYFDQQPIDTASMAQTLIIAAHITEDKDYLDKAIIAFNWFLGKNHLNQIVYDETTGGCFDGLGKHNINLNQGAESTISYLMARLVLEHYLEGFEDLF